MIEDPWCPSMYSMSPSPEDISTERGGAVRPPRGPARRGYPLRRVVRASLPSHVCGVRSKPPLSPRPHATRRSARALCPRAGTFAGCHLSGRPRRSATCRGGSSLYPARSRCVLPFALAFVRVPRREERVGAPLLGTREEGETHQGGRRGRGPPRRRRAERGGDGGRGAAGTAAAKTRTREGRSGPVRGEAGRGVESDRWSLVGLLRG